MQHLYKIGRGKTAQVHQEIGSNYWLYEEDTHRIVECQHPPMPNVNKIQGSYISTCRSGIRLILQHITVSRKVAVVPGFTCESVLVPFQKEGYRVYPYPISRNLIVNKDAFLKCILERKPSVVLIHRYFGFDTFPDAKEIIQELRYNGIIVIEDLTQTMFSDYELGRSNYLVGSIRKWFPCPDGAFVSSIYEQLPEDTELSLAKYDALVHKGKYIEKNIGDRELFRKEFAQAELMLDSRNEPYAISTISKAIISQTDISWMKETRWKNYFYLSRHLQVYSILDVVLPILKGEVVPFMLPVLVKSNRKKLQNYLAANQIFATIIWGCPKELESFIDDDTKYVYDHILCFHCDQRYDLNDMKRIIEVIDTFKNGE